MNGTTWTFPWPPPGVIRRYKRALAVLIVGSALAIACGVDAPDIPVAASGPSTTEADTTRLQPNTTTTGSTPESSATSSTNTSGAGSSDDRPPAQDNEPVVGASGVDDPYYPFAGNGGYDVVHYDLTLDYDPETDFLEARAEIRLVTTISLATFSLDFRNLDISALTVNGKNAVYERADQELMITPTEPLEADQEATVVVDYSGEVPEELGTPYDAGWVHTRNGSYVASEPTGSPNWFPVNDHPRDKATYTFRITVPAGLEAIANGTLTGSTPTDDGTEWVWEAKDEMASYLAMVATGDFVSNEYETKSGIPIQDWLATELPDEAQSTFEQSAEMIDEFEEIFGPYPFENYGHVVLDIPLGFALETQTRSLFGSDLVIGDFVERFVAHELAHQWFGNNVSTQEWDDIWLNEGWATYAEDLWSERSEGTNPDDKYRGASIAALNPPGDPGPDNLFSKDVYQRGGMTLHALRLTVGDDAFFDIARQWNSRFGGRTASTADFIALSEELSGQNLTEFFDAWLFQAELPELPE